MPASLLVSCACNLEVFMKKFLAIYIGTASALEKLQWNTMDEAVYLGTHAESSASSITSRWRQNVEAGPSMNSNSA
jgi:hypothetical protein